MAKKRRKVVGDISPQHRELLRLWRLMPAGKRSQTFNTVFRRAETDDKQRAALLELFDYLVMNAPRPPYREVKFTVDQMNKFGRFMSEHLPSPTTERSAIQAFAMQENLDEQTLERLWKKPVYGRLRNNWNNIRGRVVKVPKRPRHK